MLGDHQQEFVDLPWCQFCSVGDLNLVAKPNATTDEVAVLEVEFVGFDLCISLSLGTTLMTDCLARLLEMKKAPGLWKCRSRWPTIVFRTLAIE